MDRGSKKTDSSLDIQIYPKIQDKQKITFALVWSAQTINFQEFPNLKAINSMGAGVDHILKNKTLPSHIPIAKIVDTKLVNSMWEYLLSIVMNIVTNQYHYITQQKNGIWDPKVSKDIHNTTIGIMGLGQLGSFSATKFSDMGFLVKGYARSKKNIHGIQSFTELPSFLKDVDILINLLPLTFDTKGILNLKLFQKLNIHSYLINVGRGEHLVEKELLEALKDKILNGAILDVFQNEPLQKEHPFWKHEKIFITPHCASLTDPNSVIKQVLENYKRANNNLNILNQIDKTLGY